MRPLRSLAAITVIVAVLVGVPALLLTIGSPEYLVVADWSTALLVTGDSRLILALLSVAGWVAWAIVAFALIAEAVSALTRQRLQIHLPGTHWIRPAAGALVAAALAVPTVASADQAAPAAPPTTASQASSEQLTTPSRTYTVQPGDELWSIAEAHLGSGERWREIAALNDEIGPSARIVPGQRLMLPLVPAEAAPADDVVVVPGDTLWGIAEDRLGDGKRWSEVHDLNRDLVTDPDHIEVGWRLEVPAVEQDDPATAGPVESAESAVPAEIPPPVTDAVDVAKPVVPNPEPPAVAPPSHAVSPEAPSPVPPPDPAPASRTTEEAAVTNPAAILGSVGAALAAAIVGVVVVRRRAQVLDRPVGRQLLPLDASLGQVWTALGQRAEQATPRPSAATDIEVGWRSDDTPVTVDLEKARLTLVTGPAAAGVVGTAVTTLACKDPGNQPDLFIVGGKEWVEALDSPGIVSLPTVEAGTELLTRLCSERRLGLAHGSLAEARADHDVAEAVRPTVVIFTEPVDQPTLLIIEDALSLGETGVSVLASAGATSAPRVGITLTAQPDTAKLDGEAFSPQLLPEPARRAVLGLLAATTSPDTQPAPWWSTHDDLPPNVTPLPKRSSSELEGLAMTPHPLAPAHPTLLLLGQPQLVGARGTEPSRALSQCMEYCAWLLERPGSTPTRMARELLVAETTRRSNMSRLRSWLGSDAEGQPYLPDAYSGRITLDERVTSDWEMFIATLGGSINHASTEALHTALGLVRGEPLGSLAFQWQWAENLRTDMVSMIVDAACVLADRQLELGDVPAALAAVDRGRVAAAADPKLAVRQIEALSKLGDHDGVDQGVLALTRSLRADSRDLPDELAVRVQAAIQAPRRATS